jgi:hypothetical protein
VNAPAYYIAEGYCGNWDACTAKTLRGAKIAAARGQTFQGTNIFVGVKDLGGVIVKIAQKIHRDALDMNGTGSWREVELHGYWS